MSKHVVFLGPDLFSAYVDLVRGLKRAGARVTGIGHTPIQRLDSRLHRYLDAYEQVANTMDPSQALKAAETA